MSDRNKAFALTFARVALGTTALAHGLANVFGLFDGPGLSRFVAEMGARVAAAPELTAYAVAFGELIGGLSLLLGPGAAVIGWIFAVFLLGNVVVSGRHVALFHEHGGCEHLLALVALALVVATHGPGALYIEIKRGKGGGKH